MANQNFSLASQTQSLIFSSELVSSLPLQTYLPQSIKKIYFSQELYILFWKLFEMNKVRSETWDRYSLNNKDRVSLVSLTLPRHQTLIIFSYPEIKYWYGMGPCCSFHSIPFHSIPEIPDAHAAQSSAVRPAGAPALPAVGNQNKSRCVHKLYPSPPLLSRQQ